MRLNIGSGSHNAPKPWINIDSHDEIDGVKPDIVSDRVPFPDGSAERVYLGHVMEHVPWPQIPAFLAEVLRVLEPGGEVMVTGPDVYRALRRWKRGEEPDWLLEAVLEHAERETPDWPGSAHHWNSHEGRIVEALKRADFEGVTPHDPRDIVNGWRDWPVVNWSLWQCAVHGCKPHDNGVGSSR